MEGKERMTRIITFTIILIVLTACASSQPEAGLPNPASVYCEQNGNKHEIRTAPDGTQSGICVFPDGSTCDEWAYYRGECDPQAQTSPTPVPTIETTSNVLDDNTGGTNPGSSMLPGATEAVVDWWGVIKSVGAGAQFDDYFERQDLEQVISFGIDSQDPTVQSQIEALRDSGRIVHIYGTLVSNAPDYNGSQILVDRIEVEE